jgi:tRNA threonylcarbamoyladenosine biosynthesis protein TsaB
VPASTSAGVQGGARHLCSAFRVPRFAVGAAEVTGVWLAIDTATEIASVAAGRPPGAESGAHVQGARRHAAEIIRLIDFVLSRRSHRMADLEGIVVGDGPGSFTGLRIGWSAAKGLAHEAGLDIHAIPTLMAAAAGAALRVGTDPVAVCFDALRGQVYGAMYIFHPDRVDTLVEPAVLTPAELARVAPARPRVVVGSGIARFADQMTGWAGTPPVPLESLPPTATMLLALLGRAGAGRALDDAATAEPVYGRPAEAQAQWEARHGRPFPDSSRRAG